MKDHSLKSHPPEPMSQKELEEARKRFIEGTLSESSSESKQKHQIEELLPWESPYVREDVKKLFSLRLSEPEMLKLQYINKKTGKSMHRFIIEAVLPAIQSEIEKLTGKK